MKILVVATSYPRFPGDAAGNFVRSACLALARRGHAVKALCPHAPGLPVEESGEGVTVRRFRYALPERLETLAYGAGIPAATRGTWRNQLLLPFFVLALRQAVARHARGYDLVHAHWAPTAFLAGTVRGLPPLICTFHGSDLASGDALLRRVAAGAARRAALAVCVSESVRRNALAAGAPEGKLRVLWNGVELPGAVERRPAKSEAGLEEDCLHLAAVGRLAAEKDYPLLLQAFSLLAPDLSEHMRWIAGENDLYPQLRERQLELAEDPGARRFSAGLVRDLARARLLVIGDGPERAALEKLAEELGIADRVRFAGELPREKTLALVAACDIFITTSRREGLPTAVLEAMALGVPVVACDAEGVRDVIEHNRTGILAPREPGKVAGAVCYLLAQTSQRERLAAGAAAFFAEKRLDWDSHALALEEIYLQALQS